MLSLAGFGSCRGQPIRHLLSLFESANPRAQSNPGARRGTRNLTQHNPTRYGSNESIRYNRKFKMLRFFTAGESHGEALVAVLSGLPAGLKIDQAFVDRELWRRQQGYGRGGRQKIETDRAHFLSGVRHGGTIGAPVSLLLQNKDW